MKKISKLQVWLIKRKVIPSIELFHFSTAEGKHHSHFKHHRYEKYFGIKFMLAIYFEKLCIKVYLKFLLGFDTLDSNLCPGRAKF